MRSTFLFVGTMGLALASFGYSSRISYGIAEYRPMSQSDAASAMGGAAPTNTACGNATGSCPTGNLPNPEIECSGLSIADCATHYCYNCNAQAGAKFKTCIAYPEATCNANGSGNAACGGKTYKGCKLTMNPISGSSCSCPGMYVPYNPAVNCPTSDCTTTF